MKPVTYHQLAENELIESACFYERRREFLGDNFLDTVEKTLVKIRANPDLGKPGKFQTRSWKAKRFPFRVVYLEQTDRVWIVAIAHLSRMPDYWQERLD
ncbi:MAG: type II toxin-antitoxin system RelE/ParE family toxin [Limisphaerales bacterium]